jgi:hypothetical protein
VKLEQFIELCDLVSLSEVEKVCHLAFYFLKVNKQEHFTVSDAVLWLPKAGSAHPNKTRLAERLRNSRNTQRDGGGFRLTLKYIAELEGKYPAVGEKSQDVQDHGTILPEVDYEKTRGYIERLAKQINAAYEQNIFDGCAVLMRRLVEILLILSYQKLGIDHEIKDAAGNYLMLDGIITNAKANATLNLSRNGKTAAETFRTLGNFSAHKIEYTCKREYIKPEIPNFRALVSELLHKAGIRT